MKFSSKTEMSMAVLTLISLVLVLSVPSLTGFFEPSIQLISQYSVVSPGETVRISCSCRVKQSSYQNNDNYVKLYRDYSVMLMEKRCYYWIFRVTFPLSNVDSSHKGSYTCRQYYHHSQPISITVVVLVQPNISLSAPDGGLFWGPQAPEVTRGHSLSIICYTQPQYRGGSFHLIFDGSNTTRTELAVNHSASFYIPEADYSHQGNYSCVYEVNVSRRAFKSTRTALLTIIIRPSLVPIIASGAISGFFLLLVIPAILCLVRNKCLSDTPLRHSGPQSQNIYMNTCVPLDQGNLGEDANSDVEEDYVNVHNMRNGSAAIENDYDEDCIYQNYN